jgi:hypothetical protein
MNLFRFFVECVVAQLTPDEEQNENTAGEADGQAGHVDEGISFVLVYVPDSDFEVVFKHEYLLSAKYLLIVIIIRNAGISQGWLLQP